jgi:hypothetical protein
MEKSTTMNWQEFKSRLHQNPDAILKFQYAEDAWVDASYHITEIKQAPIVSVDCGGVMNSWTEVIVQLWEPPQKETGRAMQAAKALKIIDIVEAKLPLNPLGLVKIEFGNSVFDTRQMYPAEFIHDGDQLIVRLTPDFTQCKAIDRGGNCGTTASGEACCIPATESKEEKPELINPAAEAPCCAAGSGSC